jgi:hypothetical protein
MASVYAATDTTNVEFESEAVFESFKKLEKAVGEERQWERFAYNAYIHCALVTQEDLDDMVGDDCKRNDDGSWTITEGLEGWYATDVWDMISGGVQE